jgi:biopolymer transport protein ExbD
MSTAPLAETVKVRDTWKVRHEGSPRSVGDMTLPQVVEGLQDGMWEATDEVMGPDDTDWVAIENHPQLAEIAADLEPPPARTYDDETRLDMNALIDVCLVLLIFFMLITSYSVLQKRLEQARADDTKADLPVVHMKDAKEQMLLVKVSMQNGEPVIKLEDQIVSLEDLQAALSGQMKNTPKTQLLLQADDEVPHGVVVSIQDAAAGARLKSIHLVMPPKEQKK